MKNCFAAVLHGEYIRFIYTFSAEQNLLKIKNKTTTK